MILFQLFLSFVQIGLFAIGGGYAAMPFIQQQVMTVHHWLTHAQFADIVTISEMTPGPIAINAATFTGTLIAGLPGAIAATVGCVLPSCAIVLILAYAYHRLRSLKVVAGVLAGLRPAVIAMIASAGIGLVITALWGTDGAPLTLSGIRLPALLIFAAAFCLLRLRKASPIAVMLGAGAAGLLLFWLA